MRDPELNRGLLGCTVESVLNMEELVTQYEQGERTSAMAARIATEGWITQLGIDYERDCASVGRLPRHYVQIYDALSEFLGTISARHLHNIDKHTENLRTGAAA